MDRITDKWLIVKKQNRNLSDLHICYEPIRDLCRARTDAVDDLRRAKTCLLAMLRRLGYNYQGETHWTEAHKRYLRDLPLPDAAHNIVLEENLKTINFHVDRIAELVAAILLRLSYGGLVGHSLLDRNL